jgi:hypothetical protein
MNKIIEVSADSSSRHQSRRPFEAVDGRRHRGQKAPLHALRQRQLCLDDQSSPLLLGQRQSCDSQIPPQVDGDSKRARQHDIAHPGELHLTRLEQLDKHELAAAGHGVHHDGSNEAVEHRTPSRSGRPRHGLICLGSHLLKICR